MERLEELVDTEEWIAQDRQCLLVLASIRTRQNRWEEAVALCRSVVEIDSEDASAHLALSQFLLNYAQSQWGRMAIVDTKPFKLRVILHRIFVERPQVTGIPAWPGGAACYRRSRYIL